MQLLLRLTLPKRGGPDMVEALHAVMRPARLDRECLAAWVLQDVDAPEIVCCVEEWGTDAAVARRVGSAEFAQLLGLMEASPSQPSLEFRFVSESRGLDYVEAIRARPAAAACLPQAGELRDEDASSMRVGPATTANCAEKEETT